MRGSFEFLDVSLLNDLWERSAPVRYQIPRELFQSHIMSAPLTDLKTSSWMTLDRNLRGALAIKRSANPSLYAGPDAQQAHISLLAFEDFSFAEQLIADACEKLKSAGIVKLLFGQDDRHFFPGCPKDWEYLEDFLRKQGFEGDQEVVDVERSLVDYVPPAGCIEAMAEPYSARVCTSEDLPALRAFFDAEFPNRWKYDTLQMWNLNGPECVFGLFEGAACVGFALLQSDGRSQMPIGGAVWKGQMGANWGSLGPIGIAQSVRKKGLGDALLGSALLELKSRGVARCVIDWTTLTDWYGKHGFMPTRTYIVLNLLI